MKIAAGHFKTKCLKLMDDVQKNHIEIIITKYGKPVAKLVPVEKKSPPPIFGYLKGKIKIKGDIINLPEEKWDAEE